MTPLSIEVDDAVREHLAVDAEIGVTGKRGQHGVGDGADTELQRRTVLDEAGYVEPDGALDLAELGALGDGYRVVDVDGDVDVAEVQQAVTKAARHAGVDLCDDGLGGLDRGARGVHRGSKRAVAVLVRRRDVDERDVERHGTAAEELRHLAQEHGHVVGLTTSHRLPDVLADEQGVDAEARRHLRLRVRGGALGVKLDDLDGAEFGGAGGQSAYEALRRGGDAVYVDAVAGTHRADGL